MFVVCLYLSSESRNIGLVKMKTVQNKQRKTKSRIAQAVMRSIATHDVLAPVAFARSRYTSFAVFAA